MDAWKFPKTRRVEFGALNLLHPIAPGLRYHGKDGGGLKMDLGAVAESAGTT